jgi:exopolysaccharide production protein ExoZ
MDKPAGKLNAVQLLRCVAALLVVYCHTLDWQQDAGGTGSFFQNHFFYLQNFGAVGVDIFFVISGFIITIISYYYAKNNKVFYFFVKRFIRVVPLYWIVSLIVFAGLFLFNKGRTDTKTILATLLILPYPILVQGWTLFFEFLFYTVVTISMSVSKKKYITITILFFLVCFVLWYIVPAHLAVRKYLFNAIMLEFLLGVAIGVFYLSSFRINTIILNVFFIAGVTGLLATVFTGYKNISEHYLTVDGTHSLLRVLIWGIPSALLVAGLVLKEKMHALTVPHLWIAVGNASYSIYLTHTTLLWILYTCWIKSGVAIKTQPDFLVISSVAIVTAAGYFFYRLVETPLLQALNRKIKNLFENKTSFKNQIG